MPTIAAFAYRHTLGMPSFIPTTTAHAERVEVLSMYWHFVDVVWVVVFIVVYVVGAEELRMPGRNP